MIIGIFLFLLLLCSLEVDLLFHRRNGGMTDETLYGRGIDSSKDK
jgi:hypothetical protein